MSVPLTGVAGFFTRQGTFIGEFNRVAALYGSALDAGFQAIWAQFASSDQGAVENLPSAVENYRNTANSYQNTLIADGQTAMLLQTNDDTDVVPYTVQRAIQIVISQMKTNVQSINRPTLGATVTNGSTNLGNATVVCSTTNIYGDPLDMIFGETITLTCTQATTRFAESLSGVGEALVSGTSPYWPQGSGASFTFSITDPAVDGLVTDGAFADWSGTGNNTPTNWQIINGDAGITVFRSAAGGLRSGTDAAKILSDGASATQLGQDITLSINTVYAVCVYVKVDTLTASGTFRIALTDNNGTVLTDDAGNALSYTRNLNGQITTSYQLFTAFFSTPRLLPVTTRIQAGFSAAPASTARFITMDLVGIVPATQAYTGGPYFAAFSNTNATAVNDFFRAAITNSLGSQSFARGMDRLYGMRNMGVYFPSNVSPTVSDSLVLH